MIASSSDEEDGEDIIDGDEHTQELLSIYQRGEQLSANSTAATSSPSVSPSLHTPSPTPSVLSEATLLEQQEDDERRERLQLYIFVLRCIAYPFNARQPTDMARRHARVSKQDLVKIKQRFDDFLKGDTKIASDEAEHSELLANFSEALNEHMKTRRNKWHSQLDSRIVPFWFPCANFPHCFQTCNENSDFSDLLT